MLSLASNLHQNLVIGYHLKEQSTERDQSPHLRMNLRDMRLGIEGISCRQRFNSDTECRILLMFSAEEYCFVDRYPSMA